jgi:DNA topoisomerase-1
MAIAEELYINGWISYTRTDNTVYPKTLDLKAILRKLTHTEFRENAEALLGLPKLVPSRGKRTATDHPPIYPVGAANRKQLEDAQWKIYELVVRRFLATLAPEAVAEVTRAKIDINNELFLAHGYKIIDPGWRRHYTYIGIKEKHLPELTQGTEVSVCGVEILDKETLPPKRYGQGVLIQEMDRLGLGTKSTRHEIIQKLYERGYIEGTPIVPTVTGTAVTRALEKYAGTITSPEMTSRLEEDMDKIAEGTKELKTVVRDSRKMLSSILDVLDAHKHNVSKTIREALREQNIIGKCTDCEGNLIILRSRIGKRFVGCTNFPKCRKGYPLPQKGRIISTGKVCDTCGAPRIKLVTRRRRTYTLCINMECPEKEAQQETKTLQEPDAQSSNSNCKTH